MIADLECSDDAMVRVVSLTGDGLVAIDNLVRGKSPHNALEEMMSVLGAQFIDLKVYEGSYRLNLWYQNTHLELRKFPSRTGLTNTVVLDQNCLVCFIVSPSKVELKEALSFISENFHIDEEFA